MPPPASNFPGKFPWTQAQRSAIAGIVLIIVVALLCRRMLNPITIPDPLPDEPIRADLADHLDPNTATWQELAVIPYLGEKRAKAIVDWRDKWIAAHPGKRAFVSPTDLQHVKGIGPATASNMAPYLYFPAPATKPAAEKLR